MKKHNFVDISKCVSLNKKDFKFEWYFTEMGSCVYNWQSASFVLGNGLVPSANNLNQRWRRPMTPYRISSLQRVDGK